MWGADRWPQLFDRAGGLWLLGPAHTLGSYLFLAFLIGHIYLCHHGSDTACPAAGDDDG